MGGFLVILVEIVCVVTPRCVMTLKHPAGLFYSGIRHPGGDPVLRCCRLH